MKKFKFDPTPMWLNELEIVSTHGYNLNFKKYNLLKYISWLIFKNKIDIDYLNTEKFSFNNYEKFINEKNDMIKKKTVTFN